MENEIHAIVSNEDMKRASDREYVRRLRTRSGFKKSWLLFFALIGPGILVMLGENDGPSMLSYAATGSAYGIGFFLPFIVLTFVMAFVIQQMVSRLGAVSHRGHAELIFDRFGPFWGWFSVGDLVLGNFLTLVTEFIAIRAGASFFGVSPLVSVALSCGVVLVVSMSRRYHVWERITLALALFNGLFIPVALLSHPDVGAIGRAFVTWGPVPGGFHPSTMLLIMADIGATVTPWMIFFQQSTVMDKGLTPKDLRYGMWDTAIGAMAATIPAIATVVATAPLFVHKISAEHFQAAQFAQALVPYVGHFGSALFALGIIEAGLVAAITISSSSGYAFGEITGSAHSMNRSFREALPFYAIILVSAMCAGVLVLIPGAPLVSIILIVNVLATLSMPPALVFLLLLANDSVVMGKYVNNKITNIVATLIVILLCIVGLVWATMTVFPNVFI